MPRKTVHAAIVFSMLLIPLSFAAHAEGFSFHADTGMASMADADIWNTGISLKGTGYNTIFGHRPNVRFGFGFGISWFGLNEDELLEGYDSLAGNASGHAFIMEIGPMFRYEKNKKNGINYFGEIGVNYTKIWGSTTIEGSYSGWSFDATDEFDWDEAGISIGGGIVLWDKLEITPGYHVFIDSDTSDYFTLTAGYVFGR